MKTIKQPRPATWLAGSAVALTATHSANAAAVKIDLGFHTLSTTLDGLTIFNGISDAGHWRGGSSNYPDFSFTSFTFLKSP